MNYLFIAVSLLSAISINSLPVDTANANDVSPATVTNANRGSTTNGQPSSVQAKTFEPFNLFSGFGNFLPGGTSGSTPIFSNNFSPQIDPFINGVQNVPNVFGSFIGPNGLFNPIWGTGKQ